MFSRRAMMEKVSVLALAAGAFGAMACSHVDPTSPDTEKLPEGTACPPDQGLLDDGEDNNNQTAVVGGRGGYWYTFVDDAGTTVTPEAGSRGGTFAMSPGGANGTAYAARFHGKIAASGPVIFSGMGMNFVDPKGAYDASKFGGISFWAKKAPGTTGKVRIKVPDNNTDPDGGVCSECFNDFGMDLKLTDNWQKFTIPFFAMKQMKGWGKPRKSEIDSKTVYGIQFQVNDPGQDYDIYVDEIQFTGCGK
jgi:endoglucanase